MEDNYERHMSNLLKVFMNLGSRRPELKRGRGRGHKRGPGRMEEGSVAELGLDSDLDSDLGSDSDPDSDSDPTPARRRTEHSAGASEPEFLSGNETEMLYDKRVYKLSGRSPSGHSLSMDIICSVDDNSIDEVVYRVGDRVGERVVVAVPLAGDGGSAQEIADRLLQVYKMGCQSSARIDMLNSGKLGDPVGHVIIMHTRTPYGDLMTELAISNMHNHSN